MSRYRTQPQRRSAAALVIPLLVTLANASEARAGDIAGGTAASPLDITAQVIAGTPLNFTGGSFIVTIPAAGATGTTTALALCPNPYFGQCATGDLTYYALYDYNSGHFLDSSAPVIVYNQVISGTGTLTVTNATDAATNPSTDASTAPHPFTGGALLFTNAETFSSGSAAPSLIIQPNTTVAFDQGASTDPGGEFATDTTVRNIVNDGYLYQYIKSTSYSNIAYGDIVNSVDGAGVVTWENGGYASDGHKYRGHSLCSAGGHVAPTADYGFDNTVNLNDFTFDTSGPDYLLGPTAPTFESSYAGNFYNPGIDIQVQSNGGSGVRVFTGLILTPDNNTKKDFSVVNDSLLLSYFIHSKGSFGLSVYVQATAQFGNGQAIVDYGNGTNNTAVQGNYSSVFLQTGNFESAPTSASDVLYLQTLGLDYSGTYHDDACLNTMWGATSSDVTVVMAPGNFVVQNPDPANTGKAANHVIVTCPMLAQGVVRVETNAILQLGDGTVGNSAMKTVTLSNGSTYTGVYSDSSGNGLVLTKGNSFWPATNPEWSFIQDDGAIVVDNVPDALDLSLTWSDPKVVVLLAENQLDTIVGSGTVEQLGSLPLTLAGVSSYTGGTTIDPGATLFVTTTTALGARESQLSAAGDAGKGEGVGGGNVTNHGLLAFKSTPILVVPGPDGGLADAALDGAKVGDGGAGDSGSGDAGASSVRLITIPGDYTQTSNQS